MSLLGLPILSLESSMPIRLKPSASPPSSAGSGSSLRVRRGDRVLMQEGRAESPDDHETLASLIKRTSSMFRRESISRRTSTVRGVPLYISRQTEMMIS